ncbi:MAG: class I SAM-dependent methyltransferase [Proteobacteria bacterium]|nr:class I SAM-dependent methyltransferase [Pseudomonadota bacterium]
MTETELKIDFIGGAVGHRRRFGGGRGQALPRALGFKPGVTPRITDATAGLGRDAFLLASLGAEVTLVERSTEMYDLLAAALKEAAQANSELADIIDRMTLLHGDAKQMLPDLSPETVLVDPMHPPRSKTALVKNEMRALRNIVGTDEDSFELMTVALNSASKRVVLKWPRRAGPMEGLQSPSHQIFGKTTRYDVFMRREEV